MLSYATRRLFVNLNPVNSIFCKFNFVHIHCQHCTVHYQNRNLIRIVLSGSTCSMCTVFCQSLNSYSCFIIPFFHRGSFDDLPNQVNGEKNIYFTPWENSWHFATPSLGSLWDEWAQKFHFDDVLQRRSEVLLIGRATRQVCFDKSKVPPRSG